MPRTLTQDTLVALGVTTQRYDQVLELLETGTWPGSEEATDLPVEVGARIGDRPYDERYELRRLLGHGGSGAVYEAYDALTGETVAVKLLRTGSARAVERMRREIGVLRMLRLPGVVAYLDEGTWGELPFVAMDLVHGEPFPGTAERSWDRLADVTVGLVETVARVHRAGVIHRDLKPSNVLTADDRATVLDFGLARPERLDPSDLDGQLAGTPAYIAPEQFFGVEPSARSDLYALGVMLYEALSGRRPYDAPTLARLVHAVLVDEIPHLSDRAPELPPTVADAVMRLLARDPASRPASAQELLRVLRHPSIGPAPRVVRLGSASPVRRALDQLRAGSPVTLGGPPGSGRTRLLEDVGAALSDRGVPVARAVAAAEPFRSLAPVVGDGSEPEVALRARLRAGLVLLADDPGQLDPATAALLETLEHGAVLRVVDGPADLELGELTVAEVEALFTGPRRVHHLPDDAADLVTRRVGRLPGRILDRIGAWVRAGLAEWRGDRVAIGRPALDRLLAGLEVDPLAGEGEALGADVPSIEGLLQLLHEGRLDEVPAAARAIASHQLQSERPGVAWAVVSEALVVARRAELDDALPALLRLAACVALSTSSDRVLQQARVAIARCDPGGASGLGPLCDVGRRALQGGGPDVLAEAEALASFDDPEVELWRHRIAAFAGMGCAPEVHAAWLERARSAVGALPRGEENVAAWEARVRFRRGDFAGAAALEEALYHTVEGAVRSNAIGLAAAISWMESGRLDDAERVLRRLAETIPPRRVPAQEASYEVVVRSVRYRRGELPPPDPVLQDAIEALDLPSITGPYLLNEAAIHWRRGHLDDARRHALAAAAEFRRCRRPWGAALAVALAVRAGHPHHDIHAVAADARIGPYPGIALQALALLGLGGETLPGSRAVEGYPLGARREVLSPEEAFEMLHATRGGE